MTVVLGIVAIMTAIVLMNLPQMKGGLSIDLVAQEIAIYIRGAQVYSRATKIISTSASLPSYRSYGLHFSAQDENKFFLWADKDGSVDDKNNPDYVWDPSLDGQPQENYDLPKGFSISKIFCSNGLDSVSLNKIDIVFKLPDPEANFAEGGDNNCIGKVFTGICLKSPNLEQYRLIKTYNNGQIMVDNASDSKTVCTKK